MKQKRHLVLACTALAAAAAAGLALLPRLVQTSDSTSGWVTIPRSNLKPRQDWFLEQRSYPRNAIPAGALQRALRQRDAIAEDRSRPFSISSGVVAATPFTGVGPAGFTSTVAPNWGQMSGRTRDLAIDPTNPMRMFLATASGGIWRSTDGGASWTPLTDTEDSLAASAVAIDPSNVNTIYAGTGEGPEGAYFGVGILKSTDGGDTWTLNAGSTFARHAISDILVKPDGSVVLACSTSATHTPGDGIPYDSTKTGVFRSTNGGVTFTQTTAAKTCQDLIADPSNFSTLYASLSGANDATDGLYKSTDGGLTFSQLGGGAPTMVGRIELGISADGATLYAGGKDSGGTTRIWKSTDSGATWAAIAAAPNYCESQCGYDNAIAVAPGDANVAFFGGVPMYRTLDGGTSFVQLGDSNATTTRQLHVDHHILTFAPGSSTTLYNGNDGGLYVSTDAQATTPAWTSLGGALATTQPYNVALHPTSAGVMLAGYQDNGTELRSGANIWSERCGGDGGIALIDHTTPTTMYCSFGSSNIGISKSTDGGASFPTDVSVPSAAAGDRASFIPPLAMDPAASTTIYAGTQRLWRTTDGGANWAVQSASNDLTGGAPAKITRIAIAPSSPTTLMVITSDGRVHRSTNSGVTFTNVTAAPLPGRFGTTVVIHPTDPLTAYVGFSGFNDGTPATPGHIFKTTDGGTTWTSVALNLPDTPVNAIGIRPDTPSEIYAGTDVGTFLNTDGATWTKMTNGLPNAAVIDIQTNATTNLLAIATYGRSVFTAALNHTGPTAADLSITKTDGVTTVNPGGSTTYTITASNLGPSSTTATVADTFPASLTCTWTCAGAGGGTCAASGSGNLNDSVTLPSGGSVAYTATCSISGAASGALSNTATVTGAATDPVPGNNSATDTDTVVIPPSRVFVATSGSDSNTCSTQTTPCRNLAAAIAQVATDGEIIVLSTGEYDTAPILIGKGVKITSPSGTVAFIRQSINVNAPGGRVTLRGLTLKRGGTTTGVTLAAADSLSIEETTFDGWTRGLHIANASASKVSVTNSFFLSNQTGVQANGVSGNRIALNESRFEGNVTGLDASEGAIAVRGSAFSANTTAISVTTGPVEITRSELWNNGSALSVLASGAARLGRSHVFGNTTGLSVTAGGTLESFGTSVIRGNGTDVDGSVTTIPEQ